MTRTTTRDSFTVSAPASSGNMGPGFDVVGVALDLRNTVRVDTDGSGRLTITGHGSNMLPTDGSNLVARAFDIAAPTVRSGVDLQCTNVIPPARGLGSSTAAAACGLVAGWECAGIEWDDDLLVDALVELDGHADNAGACAHGGVVLCHHRPPIGDQAGYLDVVALGPADWLRPVVVIPDRELETRVARTVLPDSYGRDTVVQSLGAIGLLLAGLAGGHPELLADALEADVLHEPHRSPLVPELADVRSAAASTAALGTTLSGAGPTVVVWCEPDTVDQAIGSLAIDFPDEHVAALRIDARGAGVETGTQRGRSVSSRPT